jgi:hypothetical protein
VSFSWLGRWFLVQTPEEDIDYGTDILEIRQVLGEEDGHDTFA